MKDVILFDFIIISLLIFGYFGICSDNTHSDYKVLYIILSIFLIACLALITYLLKKIK